MFRSSKLIFILSALATSTIASSAMAGKDVGIEDVPAAVRVTIDRETAGGVVHDIELDTPKSGETVYEVEYRINNQEFELEISADGTLLKRSPD